MALRRIPSLGSPSPEFHGPLAIVLNDSRLVAHMDGSRHHFHEPAKALFNLPPKFLGPSGSAMLLMARPPKERRYVLYTVGGVHKKTPRTP
jgi:hypothetical protein